MGGLKARIQALIADLRGRRPIVDHAFQMIGRNKARDGGRLVSAITLPGFLSFFPLLALAFAVAGYIARYDHGAQKQITNALKTVLPGLVGPGNGQIDVTKISQHATATGVVGLVGLVFSGLGLISALRTATREMWSLPETPGNFIVAKLRDLVTLATMGVALIATFVLTAGASAAARTILDNSPIPDGGAGPVLLRVAAYAVALAGDVFLFAMAYRVLPQVKASWPDILDGALAAAIGFELLKTFGAYYLQRTTGNALYGTFAAVIGLLVWTNLVARLYVLAAAWAVTAPYDPDTPPSGTAGNVPGVVALPTSLAAPGGQGTGPDPYAILGRRYGSATLGAAVGLLAVAGAGAIRSVLPRRS